MSESELKGQLDFHLAVVRRRRRELASTRRRGLTAAGDRYRVRFRDGAFAPTSAFVTGLELEDLQSPVRALEG